MRKHRPATRDIAGPATIAPEVDATSIRQGIFFRARDDPGGGRRGDGAALPRWLPGKHAPRGRGKVIAWTRAAHDMVAVHLGVPAGVQSLEVSLKVASAAPRGPATAGVGRVPGRH